MNIESALQGGLFAQNFLHDSIAESEEYRSLDNSFVENLESKWCTIYDQFPISGTPNESQTEDDLIWPVLVDLGWTASLRQQNLSSSGRKDVPDGLLFSDDFAKEGANRFDEEWKRYELGLAIVESKRWLRPLDRRSERFGEETAPATQMLRYLRRIDDVTNGELRWGILTNGARWRLYYQGARSVSQQYFDCDLAALLNLPGHNDDAFVLDDSERRHGLRVFAIVFGRESFLPSADRATTFHERAIAESRFYEQRVSNNLSELIFGQVFPDLARAIAVAAPETSLEEVREATLILLYRLLFILYAEDRNLLPVREIRYVDYGLRERVRGDVGRRMDLGDTFSASAARYWLTINDLCRAINLGDLSIGLPPYNGGLFDPARTPLLERIRLGDQVMARVIDALSFECHSGGRHYINYRDLGVQQLGTIYEKLLEHEIVQVEGNIEVRPNMFARKGSGSYYTPDDLVCLIIQETIDPLVSSCMKEFENCSGEQEFSKLSEERQLARLKNLDPAEKLLALKICDPAMGSGHFLVNLVDYLADCVIEVISRPEATVASYKSPLIDRIDAIRNKIVANAQTRGWTVDPAQLDDRHIVRRMVLKRCVYGVDKNPMAVELAKVSLWLHTFTVGAPLSFLDHHLRCGDSLFGLWIRSGIDKAEAYGGPLFLERSIQRATNAVKSMQVIEELSDAEIAEAHRSASAFADVEQVTVPLDRFLSLIHAFDWLNVKAHEDKAAISAFFDGSFGDPVDIAANKLEIETESPEGVRFLELFYKAQELITEERFFHWQVAFARVWSDWEQAELSGGFDAVIGNPPWDRIKLQQVEWFAARRIEIARAQRAADRKRMIADLEAAGDRLAREFSLASMRAASMARIARTCGEYPMLSSGDINLYSLFVERALNLVKPDGLVGLLVPSGIASDKTAAKFFQRVSTTGRLRSLYDFENRRTEGSSSCFFEDVDSRFKFCVFVASATRSTKFTRCGFFLGDVSDLSDPTRRIMLGAEDFARLNPNTGTAPIFRYRNDAELTTAIYRRMPVFVDRSSGHELKSWPVKYTRMFDMTNDSHMFRTRVELEEKEGAYPIGFNRYDSPVGEWIPLYEGKMVQAFDHRAASVVVNPMNRHRPSQPVPATSTQHMNPQWLPEPQFWVLSSETTNQIGRYSIGLKHITSPTNARSLIASLIPKVGAGNSLPLLRGSTGFSASVAALIVANLNAISLDYVLRQKVQGQNLNLFILEQLPIVPMENYEITQFGSKTAGDIVRECVLELTYTAHDMAPFAQDLFYVDKYSAVNEPFVWNDPRRSMLRAKLDAIFFLLYGIEDREDVRYIYSTFPIIERHEVGRFGVYRSRDLCLAHMNALAAGDPLVEIGL